MIYAKGLINDRREKMGIVCWKNKKE